MDDYARLLDIFEDSCCSEEGNLKEDGTHCESLPGFTCIVCGKVFLKTPGGRFIFINLDRVWRDLHDA